MVVWAFEVLGWPIFYVPTFAYVLKTIGFGKGCLFLFFGQIVITAVLVFTYDLIGRDLLGIESVKRWIKRCFGFTDAWTFRKMIASVASLFTVFFILSAPALFICFRREGTRGVTLSGACFITMMIAIKTVIYSSAHMAVMPFYAK